MPELPEPAKDATPPVPFSRPTGGVFITRGMQVSIPAGGLVLGLGDDGQPTSSLTLHVLLDVFP